MTVLAVDAGTTTVKAALVEPGGAMGAVERRPIPRSEPQGLDPNMMWAVVADAIRGVTSRSADIEAIAVTGQGDGLWAIGRDGTPAGLAYEWNSTVAGEVVRRWVDDGTIERHFRVSDTVLWPGTAAAIWRWMLESRPDDAAKVAHVFFAKDWINFRLCGAVATDVTDGTIPFIDLATGDYRTASFDGLGCEALVDKMAPVVGPGTELGGVTPEAAAETGLAPGTPVLMGCIDGAGLMYGAHLTAPGDALAVLGTTAAALVIIDSVDSSGEPVGATLKMPGRDRYLRFLGANSGTSTLDWFLDTCYQGDDRHAQFWADLAEAGAGVLMLPYLAGERSPFLAPDATGTFLGITARTRRSDLARAVALGITFSMRHCLDAAAAGRPGSIVLSGGGAASAEWCQMVADVVGRPVMVDERPHVACAGVASLAMNDPSYASIDFVPVEPQHDYETEFAEFVDAGQRLRPLWTDLQRQQGVPG